MLPNLKADVLGVISRDGDSRRVLGSNIGSLGRGTGHVGLVDIVPALRGDTSPRRLEKLILGDKNLVRSCGRPPNGLSIQ